MPLFDNLVSLKVHDRKSTTSTPPVSHLILPIETALVESPVALGIPISMTSSCSLDQSANIDEFHIAIKTEDGIKSVSCSDLPENFQLAYKSWIIDTLDGFKTSLAAKSAQSLMDFHPATESMAFVFTDWVMAVNSGATPKISIALLSDRYENISLYQAELALTDEICACIDTDTLNINIPPRRNSPY
jgi:hypothetical protein